MGKGKRKIHIKRRIAEVLDLPLDAVCNVTRITLLSNAQMLIESYEDLYLYSDKEIIITLEGKKLSISGEQLEIIGATDDRLMVFGIIRCLEYRELL